MASYWNCFRKDGSRRCPRGPSAASRVRAYEPLANRARRLDFLERLLASVSGPLRQQPIRRGRAMVNGVAWQHGSGSSARYTLEAAAVLAQQLHRTAL